MAVVIRYRTIAERYVVDMRMVEYLRKMDVSGDDVIKDQAAIDFFDENETSMPTNEEEVLEEGEISIIFDGAGDNR